MAFQETLQIHRELERTARTVSCRGNVETIVTVCAHQLTQSHRRTTIISIYENPSKEVDASWFTSQHC